MSVRAESCRRSIPVRERLAYGGSDRAARRDGSERSRRVERREPRLAHSESPPTFSRGGRRHTDLRSRGLWRAAGLAFLLNSYAEEARLSSTPTPALGRNCTVPFEHVARRMGVRLGRSDLGNPSVDEDFASGDEATVVGGEEGDHLCDIAGHSIPPDGGGVGGPAEKAGQLGLVQADQPVARGVDHAGTDRIEGDGPALEVGRPGAG